MTYEVYIGYVCATASPLHHTAERRDEKLVRV